MEQVAKNYSKHLGSNNYKFTVLEDQQDEITPNSVLHLLIQVVKEWT